MPSAPVKIYGFTGEVISSVPRIGDGNEQTMRLGGRGEQFNLPVFNDAKTLAMEGSYFTASTPTPNTGITLSVATGVSFSDTQSLLVVDNTDSNKVQGGQGKRIYMDFIMFVVTATPTSSTQHDIAHRTDSQNRWTSGGTQVVPVNNNSDFPNATAARIYAGATTIAAASGNVRHFGHYTIRKAAAPNYIVGDLVVIKFGGVEWSNALANFTAVAQTAIVVPAPQVTIGPGHSYVLNEWAAARTVALSGELFVGYVER